MKLLIVFPKFAIGGAEKMIYDLTRKLDISEFEVTFLTHSLELQSAKNFFSGQTHLLQHTNPFKAAIKSSIFIIQNRKLLRAFNLIHGNLSFGLLFCLLVRVMIPSKKTIVTIHSVGMNTRFRDLVLNTFSVILINKVVIVAMSSFWKVMMKVFPRKIILIRNGIELRTANYGGKKKGRGGDLRLGSITRFSPDRNPFRFLDLIFHMNTCKVDYSVLMHIVGYGELQKTFEAQISKMGLMDSFRIMSYDYDKLEFFSNLDIYIGINVGDTSGLAALEAIANRVPVLSFQNLTMHDGGEDWIPSFVGVAELTKAIHELAINTTAYENLVQRQWNYLSRHHTIENMVEGYLEVYRLHGVQNKGGLVR